MSINALKRIRPAALRYVGGSIDYRGCEAHSEWVNVLAFAAALTRFEAAREGRYTHLVTIEVDGMDEPVSVRLRLT
jgi:hypothetical protein